MKAFPPIAASDVEAITYYRVSVEAAATTQLIPGDIVARVPNAGDVSVIALRGGNQLAPGVSNDADAFLAALVSAGDIVELSDAA